MKKLILSIIAVLCICQSVYGRSPIPYIKFEAGPSLNVPNVYFVEGIFGVKIKFWEFESQTYGGWLTWSKYNNETNYKPFMEIYSLNQKLIYQNVFIHFKHYCAHVVIPYKIDKYDSNNKYMYTEYKASPYWWGGSMRTISIGFEYEFK